RFLRPHKVFSDQKPAEARSAKQGYVLMSADAALAHKYRVFWSSQCKRERGCEVYRKIPEVAIVYPDNACSGGGRSLQFCFRMHFHKGIQAQLPGKADQSSQGGVVKYGGDQQHGAGARIQRFIELILVEEKIFSEQRNLGQALPYGAQVFDRS